VRVVPGKEPTFIYYYTDGKEMERVKCDGMSIEELADDLARHGIYPKDHPGENVIVGNLDLLDDERDEM
jgi:hypothetical protein